MFGHASMYSGYRAWAMVGDIRWEFLFRHPEHVSYSKIYKRPSAGEPPNLISSYTSVVFSIYCAYSSQECRLTHRGLTSRFFPCKRGLVVPLKSIPLTRILHQMTLSEVISIQESSHPMDHHPYICRGHAVMCSMLWILSVTWRSVSTYESSEK